jgi:hypothetical protein
LDRDPATGCSYKAALLTRKRGRGRGGERKGKRKGRRKGKRQSWTDRLIITLHAGTPPLFNKGEQRQSAFSRA